jgi:enoyl-CoA hydratase
MGLFLVSAADYRIGVAGPYKLTANEVAIGLTMPRAALEVLRPRLNPSHFDRAIALAEPFSPHEALAAGLLDRVVAPSELADIAGETAVLLGALDFDAHASTKRRARHHTLLALRTAIESDFTELRASA